MTMSSVKLCHVIMLIFHHNDYAAIRVEIEWKGVMESRKKKIKVNNKRWLNKLKLEEFGRRMDGRSMRICLR